MLMDMVIFVRWRSWWKEGGRANVGPIFPLSFMRWATKSASPSSKFLEDELKRVSREALDGSPNDL